MILFPKAKINIGLRITGKRDDGYHNLQTIFYPVALCDALEFVVPGEKLKDDELTTTGIAISCSADKNLVTRALGKVRELKDIPFMKIHLHKAIPHGAGLGGGSSDGAAFIKGLNRYFNLGFSVDKQKEIALNLGSDCPFFIEEKPVYAEGRGEIITRINPLPDGCFIVIIKPGFDISTAGAYRECNPQLPGTDLRELFSRDISEWKSTIINDFEKTLFPRFPVVAGIKEELYNAGAVYSSLSGSGSSVYGIFSARPSLPGTLKKNMIYSGAL